MANTYGNQLNAVAKAHGIDVSVVEGCPYVHGHGVGVVEKERVVGSDLADVLAEGQDLRDIALAIHDAAGAEHTRTAPAHDGSPHAHAGCR